MFAAAAVMQGSRGGIDVPDKDRDRIRSHLAKYYAKARRDTALGRLSRVSTAVSVPPNSHCRNSENGTEMQPRR